MVAQNFRPRTFWPRYSSAMGTLASEIFMDGHFGQHLILLSLLLFLGEVSCQPAGTSAKVSCQPAGRRPVSLLPATYWNTNK